MSKDTYKEKRTIVFPGMTINVYIPNLTAEERELRMKEVKRAASALIIASQRTKTSEKRRTI